MRRIYWIGMTVWTMNLTLTGCSDTGHRMETPGYTVSGDTVRVMQAHWATQLQVEPVKNRPYSKEIHTAGTIRPIPTQYANIAPPFAGRIVRSYVRMGQEVEKGTPLFAINCPDFTAAQKDYFQALSTMELAKKDLQRKADLSHNGVSSQKELEEAQSALLIAEKDLENAAAALRVYQVENLSDMQLGQPLVVRAPIAGELIENNAVCGHYLKDDAEPVAVVSDLSSVWVSAQVKEKDIRYISEGSKMTVHVVAYPDLSFEGEVFHVEEALDEDTRSLQVLAECKNENEKLKYGMYANVSFHSESVDLPAVPTTALLQGVDANYVFVEVAPNVFVRRNVTVEATLDGMAVISEGLRPGEKVVSQGGYSLKI